jgi:hypothetical protein
MHVGHELTTELYETEASSRLTDPDYFFVSVDTHGIERSQLSYPTLRNYVMLKPKDRLRDSSNLLTLYLRFRLKLSFA